MQAYGTVFVVDGSATLRLNEAKESLLGILQNEKMTGKPVLIFANKQDTDGALTDRHVWLGLGLAKALEESQQQLVQVVCVYSFRLGFGMEDWGLGVEVSSWEGKRLGCGRLGSWVGGFLLRLLCCVCWVY